MRRSNSNRNDGYSMNAQGDGGDSSRFSSLQKSTSGLLGHSSDDDSENRLSSVGRVSNKRRITYSVMIAIVVVVLVFLAIAKQKYGETHTLQDQRIFKKEVATEPQMNQMGLENDESSPSFIAKSAEVRIPDYAEGVDATPQTASLRSNALMGLKTSSLNSEGLPSLGKTEQPKEVDPITKAASEIILAPIIGADDLKVINALAPIEESSLQRGQVSGVKVLGNKAKEDTGVNEAVSSVDGYTYDVGELEGKLIDRVRSTPLSSTEGISTEVSALLDGALRPNTKGLVPVKIVPLDEIPDVHRIRADPPSAAEILTETKFVVRAVSQKMHGATPGMPRSPPKLESNFITDVVSVTQNKDSRFATFETSLLVQDRPSYFFPNSKVSNLVLVWDFASCNCDGFKVEGLSIMLGLIKTALVGKLAMVNGPGCMCEGLPPHILSYFEYLRTQPFHLWDVDIFVSHKLVHDYPVFPYRGIVNIPFKPKYIVGRSMVELESLPPHWTKDLLDRVNEIWVPSKHSLDAFKRSGVEKQRLHIIHEPVDTDLFDERLHIPHEDKDLRGFNFLSVFKWEPRKGIDILLLAFFTEFTQHEDVALILHTYLFGEKEPRNHDAIRDRIYKIRENIPVSKRPVGGMPTLDQVVVISDHTSVSYMPRIYRCADAFVLPTRGEGWGLPYAEAMSMGLPVIATNWSGPTEFITPEVGYLLRVKGMSRAHGFGFEKDAGKWAEPDYMHLRELMRHVFTHRDEAKRIGRNAARYVRKYLTPEAIAGEIGDRLTHVMAENGLTGSAHYADEISAKRQELVDRRANEIMQKKLLVQQHVEAEVSDHIERTKRAMEMSDVTEYMDEPQEEDPDETVKKAKLQRHRRRRKARRNRVQYKPRRKRKRKASRKGSEGDVSSREFDAYESYYSSGSEGRYEDGSSTTAALEQTQGDSEADDADSTESLEADQKLASLSGEEKEHHQTAKRSISQEASTDEGAGDYYPEPTSVHPDMSSMSERDKAQRLRKLKRGRGTNYEQTEAKVKALLASGSSVPHPRPHLLKDKR